MTFTFLTPVKVTDSAVSLADTCRVRLNGPLASWVWSMVAVTTVSVPPAENPYGFS